MSSSGISYDNAIKETFLKTLRGWTAYFHYRNCSEVLSQVKEHAEQGLRTHLRKRHKIKDSGTGYLCSTGSSLYKVWALQSADNSRLDECACLKVKNIGKPCARKSHARFDEGGLASQPWRSYLGTARRKGRKQISSPKADIASSLLYLKLPLGMTEKLSPACFSRYLRRGDLDARINMESSS